MVSIGTFYVLLCFVHMVCIVCIVGICEYWNVHMYYMYQSVLVCIVLNVRYLYVFVCICMYCTYGICVIGIPLHSYVFMCM